MAQQERTSTFTEAKIQDAVKAALELDGCEGLPAYRPTNGVSVPKLLKTAYPRYTAGAMRAKIQGSNLVALIVLPDGTVGDVKLVRSLDAGLDKEAVESAKKMIFTPGMKDGSPVPVCVTLQSAFTLGKK